MTDPVTTPPPTGQGLGERLAYDVLDALYDAYRQPGSISMSDLAAHVAAALAPLMAEEVAAAEARAWDEGATAASPYGGAYLRSLYTVNPYRADRLAEGMQSDG